MVKNKSTTLLSHGVGRRKSFVARVWLHRGKGSIVINNLEYDKYFASPVNQLDIELPFKACSMFDKYDVKANVQGGGLFSQAGAIKLGISRALALVSDDFRGKLRRHGLLTVDSRLKERKKYGQKAARRKFQFVKR